MLFGESAGRFLVEVRPANCDGFMQLIEAIPFGELGFVTDGDRVVIGLGRRKLIDVGIADAKAAWKKTFDW